MGILTPNRIRRLLAKHDAEQAARNTGGANERVMVKNALDLLTRHYPGHKWTVGVKTERDGGYMHLCLPDVTTVAYQINFRDLDPEYRAVVRGAGLMLEAMKIHRGKANFDQLDGLARTPSGVVYPDPDAMPARNPGFAEVKRGFEAAQREAQAA